jgi:hypothetical protein
LARGYLRKIVVFPPRDFEVMWLLYHKEDRCLACLKKYAVKIIGYRREILIGRGMALAESWSGGRS